MPIIAFIAVSYVAYEYYKRRKDPARSGTPMLYNWEKVALIAGSVVGGWALLSGAVGAWAADNGSNDPVGGILFWVGLLLVGWLAFTYLITRGILSLPAR